MSAQQVAEMIPPFFLADDLRHGLEAADSSRARRASACQSRRRENALDIHATLRTLVISIRGERFLRRIRQLPVFLPVFTRPSGSGGPFLISFSFDTDFSLAGDESLRQWML